MGNEQVGSSVTDLLLLLLRNVGSFKYGFLSKNHSKFPLSRHSASFTVEKFKNIANYHNKLWYNKI